jgi:PAS domain-containing protein
MFVLAQVVPEELGFLDNLLKNADKITVELVVLVAVILLLRLVGRFMGDQSKESVAHMQLTATAFQGFQNLEQRWNKTDQLIQGMAANVYDTLTKPGGMLFTLSEQNRELLEAVKEFTKTSMGSPMGILGVRADGTIVSANAQAIELLGITPSKIVGTHVESWGDDVLSEDGATLIPPSEFPATIALRDKIVSTRILGIWNRYRKERVWLLIRAEPTFDTNGKIGRVVIIMQDVGLLLNANQSGGNNV